MRELLEGGRSCPMQVRYQAALRPDCADLIRPNRKGQHKSGADPTAHHRRAVRPRPSYNGARFQRIAEPRRPVTSGLS